MANKIKLTPKRKVKFLEHLAELGNVTDSAKLIGVSTVCLYQHKKDDPEFHAAWEAAADIGVENQIDECRRRAFEGIDEPIVYQGQITAIKKAYSDTLAMFLIKARRPEYRERMIDIPQEGKFSLTINTDGTGEVKNSDG
jgi:hypothetical protein